MSSERFLRVATPLPTFDGPPPDVSLTPFEQLTAEVIRSKVAQIDPRRLRQATGLALVFLSRVGTYMVSAIDAIESSDPKRAQKILELSYDLAMTVIDRFSTIVNDEGETKS